MLSKLYTTLLGCLAVVVVFAVGPLSYDYFELPKFIGLMFVGAILGTVFIINNGHAFLLKSPSVIRWSLGAYLVGQVIAFVFSDNRFLSFAGAPYRYQGIMVNVMYLVVFVAALHFFFIVRGDRQTRYLAFLGLVAVAASFVAIISYTGIFFDPFLLGGQAYGTLGNQNYLASLLVAAGALVLLWQNTILRNIGLAIVVSALVLTGSRSAWIAAVVALVFVGLAGFKKKTNKVLLSALALCLVVGGALAYGTLNHSSLPVIRRFSFEGKELQSSITRIAIWRAGARLIIANPLYGYGQDNIKDHIYQYLPENISKANRSYVDRLHSEPFDIWASGGLLSFLGYVGLFIYVVRRQLTVKSGDTDLVVLYGLIALFLYHGVNFSTVTSNVYWYILLAYLAQKTIPEQNDFVQKV